MNYVKVKSNVIIHPKSFGRPAVMRIIRIAQETAPPNYDITITCAADGHKPGTSHREGNAFDFRTRDLPPRASSETWADRMQKRLGDEYFVQAEPNKSCPDAAPHIHTQWNGKTL